MALTSDKPELESANTAKKIGHFVVGKSGNVTTEVALRPGIVIFFTIMAVVTPLLFSIALVYGLRIFHVSTDFLNSNLVSSGFAIISELLYLVALYFLLRGHRSGIGLGSLGWRAASAGRVIFYTVMGVGWYFVLSSGVNILVKLLFPDLDLNQKQEIGIQHLQSTTEFIVAYISLAIVPPIVEETLFRGFLFRGLRRSWSFLPSALLVSALFGLVHGQLNVAIDTFCLSLVLCYIVDKTDSLIPAVLAHAFKNNLAFVLLFTNLLPMLH